MSINRRLINTGGGGSPAVLLNTVDVSSTLDQDKQAIAINSNGDFLYVFGTPTGITPISYYIYSFTFGTQKDLSTISSYQNAYFSEYASTTLGISANGRNIYFNDNQSNARGWVLCSSWQVSGGLCGQKGTSFYRGYDTDIKGFDMGISSTKFFMVGYSSSAIHEFDISNYDVELGSYVQSYTFSSPSLPEPDNCRIFSSGTKMLVSENTTQSYYLYDLPNPYSLTGITFNSSFELPDFYKPGFAIDEAGLNLYSISGQTLYQYTLAF